MTPLAKRVPSACVIGSKRGGVCRGCGVETTLRKVERLTWECLDCGHLNEGRFPTTAARRKVPPEAVDRYLNGESAAAIAQDYGVTFQAIYDRLRRAGVKPRQRRAPRRDRGAHKVIVPDALLERYGELTLNQIADLAGVSVCTVSRRLRERGVVPVRGFRRPPAFHLATIDKSIRACERAREIIALRERGLSWGQIRVKYGAKTDTRMIALVGQYRSGKLLAQRLGLEPTP